MLLGTLGASLLRNMLAGKGIVRVGYRSKKKFLIPSHPLTNFEFKKYYQNEPRFNGVFPRNNLPSKIKDGAYVINLDEYSDTFTHWVGLFCTEIELI